MNQNKLLTIIVAIILISVPLAIAAPTGGILSGVSSDRATNSGSQSLTIQGGNVTEATITGRVITDRWSGFYGNATGQLFIGDSGGNTYFEWTTVDMTGGVVYATDAVMNDWTNLRPAVVGDMPAYIQGVATDNYAATFTSSEVFNSATISIPATAYALTWQNVSGTAGTGALRTYSLFDDTDNNLVFAGKILDDTDSFVGGKTLDYQILVPAQNAVDTTYHFYLEMP